MEYATVLPCVVSNVTTTGKVLEALGFSVNETITFGNTERLVKLYLYEDSFP